MYPTSTRDLLSNSNNNQSFSPSRSSTIAQQSSNITHFGGISNNSFGSSSAMGTTSFANANDSREIQQQFTPNFLFGNQQPLNRRSFATPTRHLLPSYGSPGILKHREPLNSGNSKNVHWSPVLVRGRSRSKSPEDRKMQRLSANTGKSASSTLWNGPPLRSLNEDILGPPEKQSRIEMPEPLPMPTTTNLLTNINQQQQQPSALANSSVGAENGREIIELDDEEEEDIYWVTVFGFQPAQHDDILELFSRHGDIMAQKSPKQGNWLHIRYSSPIHAKQALAKNATIFHGQMIGVAQCMDRDTMDHESATQQFTTPIIPQSSSAAAMNKSANLNGSLMEKDNSLLLNGSPLVPSTSAYKSSASVHHNTSLPSRARLSISSRAGMRPLNSSSFISADGSLNHSMDNNSFQGNQKNDGGGADDSFIGKIWNMFGGGANGN